MVVGHLLAKTVAVEVTRLIDLNWLVTVTVDGYFVTVSVNSVDLRSWITTASVIPEGEAIAVLAVGTAMISELSVSKSLFQLYNSKDWYGHLPVARKMVVEVPKALVAAGPTVEGTAEGVEDVVDEKGTVLESPSV